MLKMQTQKQLLSEQYPYRIELHAHTNPTSGCSEVTPEHLCQVYKELGFDAVVVTNHFFRWTEDGDAFLDSYMNAYERFRRCAVEMGLQPIFGAEIRFTENSNDYLLYGVNRQMLKEIFELLPYGVENFRKNYAFDGVFVQAHPFRNNMESVPPEILDGIEVYNMHPNHNSRIGIAAQYAKDNNLKIRIGGSDYHHPHLDHEGLAVMRTRTLPMDTFELAQILKEGDYLFEFGDALLLP